MFDQDMIILATLGGERSIADQALGGGFVKSLHRDFQELDLSFNPNLCLTDGNRLTHSTSSRSSESEVHTTRRQNHTGLETFLSAVAERDMTIGIVRLSHCNLGRQRQQEQWQEENKVLLEKGSSQGLLRQHETQGTQAKRSRSIATSLAALLAPPPSAKHHHHARYRGRGTFLKVKELELRGCGLDFRDVKKIIEAIGSQIPDGEISNSGAGAGQEDTGIFHLPEIVGSKEQESSGCANGVATAEPAVAAALTRLQFHR